MELFDYTYIILYRPSACTLKNDVLTHDFWYFYSFLVFEGSSYDYDLIISFRFSAGAFASRRWSGEHRYSNLE